MRYFVYGFIVALITVVPAVVFFLNKMCNKTKKNRNGHLLEELGKLTGELAHEIKNPLSTIKINLKLVSEELEDSISSESDGCGPQQP